MFEDTFSYGSFVSNHHKKHGEINDNYNQVTNPLPPKCLKQPLIIYQGMRIILYKPSYSWGNLIIPEGWLFAVLIFAL